MWVYDAAADEMTIRSGAEVLKGARMQGAERTGNNEYRATNECLNHRGLLVRPTPTQHRSNSGRGRTFGSSGPI